MRRSLLTPQRELLMGEYEKKVVCSPLSNLSFSILQHIAVVNADDDDETLEDMATNESRMGNEDVSNTTDVKGKKGKTVLSLSILRGSCSSPLFFSGVSTISLVCVITGLGLVIVLDHGVLIILSAHYRLPDHFTTDMLQLELYQGFLSSQV